MEFNRYFNNEELDAVASGWARSFPQLVKVSELGKSHEGKAIPLLTLTNEETGAPADKPAVWIDANIHATEVAGTTVALHIAHTLLSGYGSDARCTRLLDTTAFYIVPRLNPDGAAWALAGEPRYIRSGTRPFPYGEPEAGLHEEDIDGDGRILQMRVPDPNGDWKVSSLESRLMQKRRSGRAGRDVLQAVAGRQIGRLRRRDNQGCAAVAGGWTSTVTSRSSGSRIRPRPAPGPFLPRNRRSVRRWNSLAGTTT